MKTVFHLIADNQVVMDWKEALPPRRRERLGLYGISAASLSSMDVWLERTSSAFEGSNSFWESSARSNRC